MTTFFRSGSTCEGLRRIIVTTGVLHCTFTTVYTGYSTGLIMYNYSKPEVNECSQYNAALHPGWAVQLQFTKLEHVLQCCSVQRIGGLTLANPTYA
jgi:hypothetical protein